MGQAECVECCGACPKSDLDKKIEDRDAFKLVKVQGEFVWHSHDDTDEAFIVVSGILDIEFRDGKVRLEPGEMFVVPKGVEHRPVARDECRLMLVEPKGVVNTGNAGGQLTAGNDVWV